MHDLKTIRENPTAFDAALARRGASPLAAQIVALDERRRAVLTQVQDGQARRNEASKALAEKETVLNSTISGLKEELSKLRRETSDQDASAKSAMAKMEQDRAAALKELADLQAKMREIQAAPKP